MNPLGAGDDYFNVLGPFEGFSRGVIVAQYTA
jgi:hypothetical protein